VIHLDRLQNLLNRLASYSPVEVAIELLLIGLVVYAVVRFVRGTRAAGALKGIFVIIVVATVAARVVGGGETFQRLAYLYDRFLAIFAIGLLIIFQPELRRALIRLGETPFFRTDTPEITRTVDAISEAAAYLARSRFGAIIVIERQIGLKGLVEGGTPIGAELTARLLQTIFFPGTALHDLAVIIKGDIVEAAGVQLPLADPADMPDPQFGSRHRAAVGLAKECDAIVIVVSEETGNIRIAERGLLSEPFDARQLREELRRRLKVSAGGAGGPGAAREDDASLAESQSTAGTLPARSKVKEPAA
jgi:diadenylate cyclase